MVKQSKKPNFVLAFGGTQHITSNVVTLAQTARQDFLILGFCLLLLF